MIVGKSEEDEVKFKYGSRKYERPFCAKLIRFATHGNYFFSALELVCMLKRMDTLPWSIPLKVPFNERSIVLIT